MSTECKELDLRCTCGHEFRCHAKAAPHPCCEDAERTTWHCGCKAFVPPAAVAGLLAQLDEAERMVAIWKDYGSTATAMLSDTTRERDALAAQLREARDDTPSAARSAAHWCDRALDAEAAAGALAAQLAAVRADAELALRAAADLARNHAALVFHSANDAAIEHSADRLVSSISYLADITDTTINSLVALPTIYGCIDARHDVGMRHRHGELDSATCHDCGHRYDRQWSPAPTCEHEGETEPHDNTYPIGGGYRCTFCGAYYNGAHNCPSWVYPTTISTTWTPITRTDYDAALAAPVDVPREDDERAEQGDHDLRRALLAEMGRWGDEIRNGHGSRQGRPETRARRRERHPRIPRCGGEMSTTVPGSQVTRADITPECRANRTDEGAWHEAVQRLHQQYAATVAGWTGRAEQPTLHLVLTLERPATGTASAISHAAVPEGQVAFPCCGRTPLDVAGKDQIAQNPSRVTCPGAAVDVPRDQTAQRQDTAQLLRGIAETYLYDGDRDRPRDGYEALLTVADGLAGDVPQPTPPRCEHSYTEAHDWSRWDHMQGERVELPRCPGPGPVTATEGRSTDDQA